MRSSRITREIIRHTQTIPSPFGATYAGVMAQD